MVLDLGCGNGKYLNVNPELIMIGSDRSNNLLELCKSVGNLFTADSLNLPIRSNSFDNVISIAVIHHFSSYEFRIRAVQEITRVLKSKGRVLIYVWAYE